MTTCTPAPYTRAVSAASAATGASEVPADTTVTRPRAVGSGPTVTHRATGSRTASGTAASTASEACSVSRVASTARSGCAVVQRAEDLDDLLGGLAGAVDHLGVTGARGAVGVEAGVPQVVDASRMLSSAMAANLSGRGTGATP